MSSRSAYDFIRSEAALADYCRDLENAAAIAVDTEFVSEDRYRPELCLLQVASRRVGNGSSAVAAPHFAIIDPLALTDMTPFWKVLAGGDHQTIVHAGRQEWLF